MRINQVQLYVIHVRLVRADGTVQLAHQRFLRVILLLGNNALLVQTFKTFKIELSISERGFIFIESGFGLAQCNLIRTRVNHGKKIAFFNFLAFAEMNFYKLAVNAALHHDCIESFHGAQAVDIDRQIADFHRRYTHRDDHGTAALLALPGS